MATVHFAPYSAIKYIGSKAKVFHTSLARPKPKLKKGDIVIVDKKTAFNLVHKGFGEFELVEEISFVKADTQSAARIKELEDQLDGVITQQKYNKALETIKDLDTKLKTSWKSTKVLTEFHKDEDTQKSAVELIDESEGK
jgi:hypothetical protein